MRKDNKYWPLESKFERGTCFVQICTTLKNAFSKKVTLKYQRIWDRNENGIQEQAIHLFHERIAQENAVQNSGPDASDDEEVAEEGVVEEGKGNEKEDEVCIPAFDGDFVTSFFEQQHPSIFKERDETREEKNNVSTESLEDCEKLEKAETVILELNMLLMILMLTVFQIIRQKLLGRKYILTYELYFLKIVPSSK